MKLYRKVLGVVLSAAMVLTVFAVPAKAFADDSTWEAPLTAMEVDHGIVKIGAHSNAVTVVDFLGGNLVTERASDYSSITNKTTPEARFEAAKALTRLGAFGSAANKNPDPYLWNYFYNRAVEAGAAAEGAVVSNDAVFLAQPGKNMNPKQADREIVDEYGTCLTLVRRPEVLFGTDGGYDDLIAELEENKNEDPADNYEPEQCAFDMANLASFVNDMYNLSDAIIKSGKPGRYGDTEAIAENYEAYLKGLQCYILSQINAGKAAMKTVAVVDISQGMDTNDDGKNDKFPVFNQTVSTGTSTDRPSECLMYITKNLFDDPTVEKVEGQITTNRGTGNGFYASAKDIAEKADVVIRAGLFAGNENDIRQAFADAGSPLPETTPVYGTDPTDCFSIRANSAENAAGVGIFGGFVYPEIINPIYAQMYVYEKFWHLNDSVLVTFANANFANASLPAGIARSGEGYSAAYIDDMIAQGLQYYVDNEASFKGTTLEVSGRLALPAPTPPPVVKKANPMKVTSANKTIKVKTLKKKALTYKAITVKNNKGTVSYSVKYANAKAKKALKFAKGKLTVRKGTKKGKYKVTVTVKAKGTSAYAAKKVKKTVTVTVK